MAIGRPQTRFGYKVTTLYLAEKPFNEFKEFCRYNGKSTGEALTELIIEHMNKVRPKNKYVCPVCGKKCLSMFVLQEHGDRYHKEIGGKKLVSMWHQEMAKNAIKNATLSK